MPDARRYPDSVYSADESRRRGATTWDGYAGELRGQMNDPASMGLFAEDFARGVRDRSGRLRELEDLGGRPGPGDTGTGPGDKG